MFIIDERCMFLGQNEYVFERWASFVRPLLVDGIGSVEMCDTQLQLDEVAPNFSLVKTDSVVINLSGGSHY